MNIEANLRNRKDQSGEENKLLPQLYLSLLNNMDPERYFSGYNLKNTGRIRSFDMIKSVELRRKIFTFMSCFLHNN